MPFRQLTNLPTDLQVGRRQGSGLDSIKLLNVTGSTTRLYYIAESYDDRFFCLSAMGVKASVWHSAYDRVQRYRTNLHGFLGIPDHTKIRARDLVRGRSRLSPRLVTKWSRSKVLFELLALAASLPEIHIASVSLTRRGSTDAQLTAWRHLLNSLNRICQQSADPESILQPATIAHTVDLSAHEHVENIVDSLMGGVPVRATRAILITDPCKDTEVTRVTRKLAAQGVLHGDFEWWMTDSMGRMFPSQSPKDQSSPDTAHSHFAQLVDCIAYALLKRETSPSRQIKKYGINKAFDKCVRKVSVTPGWRTDQNGVTRV